MTDSSFPILRFHLIPGFSIRAGFDGGTLSSDFGALLPSEADKQTGLIDNLVQAIDDKRHPSNVVIQCTICYASTFSRLRAVML